MIVIFVVIGLIIAIAAILIYIGVKNPTADTDKILQSRLEEFNRRGEQIDLEKIELSQPFTERVIYPIARSLGNLAVRFTPQNALQDISKKLELAGSPGRMDPTMVLSMQFIGLVLFGGIVVFVFTVGQTHWPAGRIILFTLAFGMVGFYFPQLWLGSLISRRQKSVRRAMPDARRQRPGYRG